MWVACETDQPIASVTYLCNRLTDGLTTCSAGRSTDGLTTCSAGRSTDGLLTLLYVVCRTD